MKLKFILIQFAFIYSISSSAQINDSFRTLLDEGVFGIVEELGAVGISIAVISGEDEWSGAGGLSSTVDSLNTEHVLALGSITKPIVSACILGLMEEDKLRLSDPIHLYLGNRAFVDSTISIKQLLYHTSGIYNYTNNPTFFDVIFEDDSKIWSAEETLDSFLLAPSFDKGERQEYSNSNYLLLGMIIEQITGRPYYDEIIERFDLEEKYPSLSVAPYLQSPESMAHLWFDSGSGVFNVQEVGISLNGLFSSAGAAGAFVATPEDLARFGNDLFTGELLNEASMDSFYNYHPFLLEGQIPYGLGVWQSETFCGISAVGHNGGIIYTADLHYIEDYDMTVAVMTNDGRGIEDIGGTAGIAQEIICLYEETLTDTADPSLDAMTLDVYPNPFSDQLNISLKNDQYEAVRLELINDIGERVVSKTYAAQHEIDEQILDSENLSTGVYYLKLTYGDQNVIKKIIKI